MTKRLLWGLSLALIGALVYLQQIIHIPSTASIMNPLSAAAFSSACVSNGNVAGLDRFGELKVASWNIYKQQGPGWHELLTRLVDDNQLVLLQEAKLAPPLTEFIAASGEQVLMARAFEIYDTPMGVMNIAASQVTASCAVIAPEPWIAFPKSALLSTYSLSDGRALLVVNIHSINFEWGTEHYIRQMSAAERAMQAHTGPIIFAGDMNTWNDARMAEVERVVKDQGLQEAIPPIDTRTRVFGLSIDHLYYRDLELIEARAFETQSSDHNAIQATFRLPGLSG